MASEKATDRESLSAKSLETQTNTGLNSTEKKPVSGSHEAGQASEMKQSQEAPQYAEGIPLALICFGLMLAVMCLSLVRFNSCPNHTNVAN